jgi:7-cyano-7-deazaguanine synthase
MAKRKSIVIFSGGMDSAVLIADRLWLGEDVVALSINYGQRHRVELEYADRFAKVMGVCHEVANLTDITRFLGGSSQTDPSLAVPRGHYEAETMKLTIVPNRNMMMLSIAVAFAISQKAAYVAYAAHAGDHAVYPDCREVFVRALNEAVQLCDWAPPVLVGPFVTKSKADIVSIGAALRVPFELTWSCYEGGAKHCGACGTCVERREAFILAGVDDPTEYSDSAPLLTVKNGKSVLDWKYYINGGTRSGMAGDPL